MIDAFSHVTLSCSNLIRSTAFYKTLGFEVTRKIGELDSDGVARAFALPRGHLDVVHLAPPEEKGAMTIDLVQWRDPPPGQAAYEALNSLGLNRLALTVSHLDATVATLRTRGIAFLSDPQPFGECVRSAVCRDPDGVFIQLIEGLN
jgi:glyoxylase I family protein